jgi:hypothetical protein
MDAYIFNADIYCADCGAEIVDECRERGIADNGDSDQFPQGPYPNSGGEADCPQHCGSCHAFLENPLTGDGDAYVLSHIADDPESPVVQEWREFYGYLEASGIVYHVGRKPAAATRPVSYAKFVISA